MLLFFAKASKAAPEVIKELVNELLALKKTFKDVTGKDYVPPAGVAPPAPAKKEAVKAPQPKEKATNKTAAPASAKPSQKGTDGPKEEVIDLSNLCLFCGNSSEEDVLRCLVVAELAKKAINVSTTAPASVAARIPFYPALVVPSIASSSGYACKAGTVIFGVAAVIKYLSLDCPSSASSERYFDLLDEEVLSSGEFLYLRLHDLICS